jgi:hypothetical protein
MLGEKNLSPLLVLLLDPGSGMDKTQDPGFGRNIPDPQHWMYVKLHMRNLSPLIKAKTVKYFFYSFLTCCLNYRGYLPRKNNRIKSNLLFTFLYPLFAKDFIEFGI